MSAKPQQLGPSNVGAPASSIPLGLRVLGMALRALFIGALVVVTVRVSSPPVSYTHLTLPTTERV